MQQAIESVEQGFTAVAIPGNAELQGEVDEAGQHQQLTLAQQDMALDKIQQAAARVADLGLGMMHELRVCHHWLEYHVHAGQDILPHLYQWRCPALYFPALLNVVTHNCCPMLHTLYRNKSL